MSQLSEINMTDMRSDSMWSAADVWIKKPHVVNKRLCGVTETEYMDVDTAELIQVLFSLLGPNIKIADISMFLHADIVDKEHETAGRWCVGVRTIIPKVNKTGESLYKEVIIKDNVGHAVTFIPFEETGVEQVTVKSSNIYQIQLQLKPEEWMFSLHALTPEHWWSDGVVYPKLSWLCTKLLPKLSRWALESKTSEFKSTLSLIPVEKYGILYHQLKEKYKALVKVWPEVTDPEKFVFEDVAIATYLLVLWGEERTEKGTTTKQSFVDLGCGNGLLVHILNNEGHPGKGMDIRKRKIWDMYGPGTHLEENAITPSNDFLFPTTDWLIGNHSDELTPWIPVIAARSSYSCRYFVIPCCFYDFCGKYQRRQCKKSQYKEYIDFVTDVSTMCGFYTEEDCLRIPSTKRVCIIGKGRRYRKAEEALVEKQRSDYIKRREALFTASGVSMNVNQSSHYRPNDNGQNISTPVNDWVNGFQPREKTETIRNCAALPRAFVDAVVLRVAKALLSLTERNTESSSCGDAWNTGGSMLISEVVNLLDQSSLQALKKECGGLQTLLKNNHQVFRVEGGRVFIRDWRKTTLAQSSRVTSKRKPPPSGALKTRFCWFHTHHPQGCPLLCDHCAFAHGETDLKNPQR
ncbi:probable tRNA (uracil-O(2)-)-methyltransferase isoform X1 [Carassius carassius]|uniref:probable tRNA (uracil-O(2)-)-methyltransferase isoform X1 n=2 Tax=Carassius carassius TaxID=217509 RepID=UPI002868B23E|nr:probable tRNA (uracil-O(2)-)-methyltransferase isoform X1 [Carassius carassius]